jgi:hypothetical protein
MVKMSLKRLVLTNPSPPGLLVPESSVLIEPPHLSTTRQDKARRHLRHGQRHPPQGLRHGRSHCLRAAKFLLILLLKKLRFRPALSGDQEVRQGPEVLLPHPELQLSALYSVGFEQHGDAGPHFTTTLRELATQLVTRPGGCPLMRGPFALSHMGALKKTLHTWRACLTWTTQREFVAQIVRSVDSFHACTAFLTSVGQLRVVGGLGDMGDVG